MIALRLILTLQLPACMTTSAQQDRLQRMATWRASAGRRTSRQRGVQGVQA